MVFEHSPFPFVGRTAELDTLVAALDATSHRHGGVILLAGEPGIGKTRLANEVSGQAIQNGFLVLWGRCYEGNGAPAFWPWVQIIRTYLQARGLDMLRTELGVGAADLTALVPELRDWLPEVPPITPIEGEQARFRMFDSVTSALVRASHSQPLLLIFDDLHWADAPSLLLLRHLAAVLSSSNIFVIGTYRPGDTGRDHPLTTALADLARRDSMQQISLHGLDADQIVQLIVALGGQPPVAALLSAVMDATTGNPFFATQLARLLTQTDAAEIVYSGSQWVASLPTGVRAAIVQRVQRLSSMCQQLLQIAAVIGRECSLRVLRLVGELAGDSLLNALDESVAAQLLVAVPAHLGSYRFVHALVRETLYESLPLADRTRLHRRVALALEQLYAVAPESHIAELAYHFCQAASDEDVETAMRYSLWAAAHSNQLLAYEDAAQHYVRALQLLDLAVIADPIRRCDLLLALGAARSRSGATKQANETYTQAAELARLAGDPVRLGRSALGLAGTVVTPGISDAQIVALLNEALSALDSNALALRVQLLARLAMEYRYSVHHERRDALSAEAVALARTLNDPLALAAALQARHYALLAPDTLDQRMAITLELEHLADTTGERQLLLQSLPWRVADLLDLGHVQAADLTLAEAAQLAIELRQPLYGWYLAMFSALRALMNADLAAAEQLVDSAHALGMQVQPRVSEIYHAAQLFMLRREQMRLAELDLAFREILVAYPGMPIFRCFLAQIALQAGRTEAAQALLTVLCAERCAALPTDQLWLGALALLAEVCVALGDRSSAVVLYSLLLPYAARNVMVGVPICLGCVALYLGQLAHLCGDLATGERWLIDAIAKHEKLSMPLLRARSQIAYAVLLMQTDRTAQAGILLASARAVVTEQHQELIQRINMIQARLVTTVPDHNLTDRELTTLRLVAQGKSTREIASIMAVSIPTVERHITNLYAKIGTRSRAEATAFALRHGLLAAQ